MSRNVEASPINYTVDDLKMPKIKGSDVAIIVEALRHGEKSFPNASKRDTMRKIEREIKDANEGNNSLATSTDLKYASLCLDTMVDRVAAGGYNRHDDPFYKAPTRLFPGQGILPKDLKSVPMPPESIKDEDLSKQELLDLIKKGENRVKELNEKIKELRSKWNNKDSPVTLKIKEMVKNNEDAIEGYKKAIKNKLAFLTIPLDVIAGELEVVDPRLALAIDQVSDRLEKLA